MPRNLDMTALRSFAVVADSGGGVTRAAGLLHLTQSAVSMQLKRLEESLGRALLDRSGRGGVSLTADGEQLLGYAKRMLRLNDEVFSRLTDHVYEGGEFVLGVPPHDIVYPAIPEVLKTFHAEFPRMKVQLVSSYTARLRAMFTRGECDAILTTEDDTDAGGETCVNCPPWSGSVRRVGRPGKAAPPCAWRLSTTASSARGGCRKLWMARASPPGRWGGLRASRAAPSKPRSAPIWQSTP